jgi:hypothetical protein
LERGNADGVRYYMKTVHLATKLRLTDGLLERAFPKKMESEGGCDSDARIVMAALSSNFGIIQEENGGASHTYLMVLTCTAGSGCCFNIALKLRTNPSGMSGAFDAPSGSRNLYHSNWRYIVKA